MTKEEKITAYVTKYALTKGIFVVNANICKDISPLMISYRIDNDNDWNYYAHKGEWYTSLPEAIQKANKMRIERISSLRKSISKVENMEFKIINKDLSVGKL